MRVEQYRLDDARVRPSDAPVQAIYTYAYARPLCIGNDTDGNLYVWMLVDPTLSKQYRGIVLTRTNEAAQGLSSATYIGSAIVGAMCRFEMQHAFDFGPCASPEEMAAARARGDAEQ